MQERSEGMRLRELFEQLRETVGLIFEDLTLQGQKFGNGKFQETYWYVGTNMATIGPKILSNQKKLWKLFTV